MFNLVFHQYERIDASSWRQADAVGRESPRAMLESHVVLERGEKGLGMDLELWKGRCLAFLSMARWRPNRFKGIRGHMLSRRLSFQAKGSSQVPKSAWRTTPQGARTLRRTRTGSSCSGPAGHPSLRRLVVVASCFHASCPCSKRKNASWDSYRYAS